MADQFNTGYSNDLLGGAQTTLPELFAQVNKANQAIPDIANQIANYQKFGGQAALGASTPGTAFGMNQAQAAGANNLLQSLTPSSTSVWAGMQNPMEGLIKQAQLQTDVNKQQAAGPMALAELGLRGAEIGNRMENAPMNQLLGAPSAAQIPYQNISTMLGAGLNAINTGVSNIERTGVTGMPKWQALQNIQNQVRQIGGQDMPLLGQLVPTVAYSPNAVKQAGQDQQQLGLTPTASSDPYIENQKYMQMVDNANNIKANYGKVMDAYGNANSMFSNMSKGAVTTQALPAILQRFVVDPSQTVINQNGKPTTLQQAGFLPGNDPATIQKNLDLIKAQPNLARGVFAGIKDANGNSPFTPDQINQMVDKDGNFNPDAARLALKQAQQQANIDMEKANFITSNKMADIMANNNLQGAHGKVFSAQDAANKGYNYIQQQKALVSKNYKPITLQNGTTMNPGDAYDKALSRTGDPYLATKMVQNLFPAQVTNASQ